MNLATPPMVPKHAIKLSILMDSNAERRALRTRISARRGVEVVGRPQFVDLQPAEDSYLREEHGSQWSDSLRHAIRKSCASLPQRCTFAKASWRIAAARKINGAGILPETGRAATATLDARLSAGPVSPVAPSTESTFEPASDYSGLLDSIQTPMETE